jgi:hypothetical protein
MLGLTDILVAGRSSNFTRATPSRRQQHLCQCQGPAVAFPAAGTAHRPQLADQDCGGYLSPDDPIGLLDAFPVPTLVAYGTDWWKPKHAGSGSRCGNGARAKDGQQGSQGESPQGKCAKGPEIRQDQARDCVVRHSPPSTFDCRSTGATRTSDYRAGSSARAADRDRRHPEGDREFAIGRAAGV